MKQLPVALQLYSVREEAKDDYKGVLKKVASMGYEGVELAGMYGQTPLELKKVFDDLGLKVVSNHGALPALENRAEIIDTAEALGFKYHISGKGPEDFATIEKCRESGAAFQAAAGVLAGSGIHFGIHNHWWEFSNKFDGKTAHQIALETAPDIFAQLDTYWIQTGGSDPAEIIRSTVNPVHLIHIKDGPCDKDKAMTAVGNGAMEWGPVMEAAVERGVEWLIVEQDRSDGNMMEDVEKSLEYLVGSGFGKKK